MRPPGQIAAKARLPQQNVGAPPQAIGASRASSQLTDRHCRAVSVNQTRDVARIYVATFPAFKGDREAAIGNPL
jgi:hypothetical protein